MMVNSAYRFFFFPFLVIVFVPRHDSDDKICVQICAIYIYMFPMELLVSY